MRPIMNLAAVALGRPFVASSTSKPLALDYAFTDINIPDSTGVLAFGLNAWRRVAASHLKRGRQDRRVL
jgi:hypothetical protein